MTMRVQAALFNMKLFMTAGQEFTQIYQSYHAVNVIKTKYSYIIQYK